MNEKLFSTLNDQINYEFYSAHIYLSMAAYCSNEGWDGLAHFFHVQAEEERFHAMKIYQFLADVGYPIRITGFEDPVHEFTSVLNVFEVALHHEKGVTERFYNLQDIAHEGKEYKTINFLNWFIQEQVEEEASFESHIKRLKHIQNDGHAMYQMDQELAARVFTPPTNA